MRKFFTTAFVLVAMLVFATSGFALERTLTRAGAEDNPDWNAGSTCTIQYWNGCVGWTWVWSGWSPNDRFGVAWESCCAGGALTSVDIFNRTAAPPGYGFTCTLDAFATDAQECLTGASLGSATFLPDGTTQNVAFAAPVSVPAAFAGTVTIGTGAGLPSSFGTDFDAMGPTGPQGCGLCFPTTRISHSYYYGLAGSPICPGSKLSVICEVEWRFTAYLACGVSVEDESWGNIKNLYR